MTTYTPAHSASDMAGIVIDFIVEFGIVIVGFVSIIVIILIFSWLRGYMRGR